MTEEETSFDPEVDIDPNDAIELDYDEETDTEETPANDQVDEPGEEVEGASPVDDSFEDAEPDSAENEIGEDE